MTLVLIVVGQSCRCQNLSDTEYKSDAVIIAGDISDDSQVIEDTLKLFLSKWAYVFFVPGNHELWMRRSDSHLKDSLGECYLCIHPYILESSRPETLPRSLCICCLFAQFILTELDIWFIQQTCGVAC